MENARCRQCQRDHSSSRSAWPLWLLSAFAIALLTLLGAAGKALGYDRHLESNTTTRRTHSVFRQSCMLYKLIPTMPALRPMPLVQRFAEMLGEPPVFADTFGQV